MPRGGKRPGAGAPFGNTNACGPHAGPAERMELVCGLLVEVARDPVRARQLALELCRAGLLPLPEHADMDGLGRVTDFLYRRWFNTATGRKEAIRLILSEAITPIATIKHRDAASPGSPAPTPPHEGRPT
jgi:hypothetical protein